MFKNWTYYCKCCWRLGLVLTLSGILETIKAHLKSVFFLDQCCQPCLVVLKGSRVTPISSSDSTILPLGLGCPFQRCKCCENGDECISACSSYINEVKQCQRDGRPFPLSRAPQQTFHWGRVTRSLCILVWKDFFFFFLFSWGQLPSFNDV